MLKLQKKNNYFSTNKFNLLVESDSDSESNSDLESNLNLNSNIESNSNLSILKFKDTETNLSDNIFTDDNFSLTDDNNIENNDSFNHFSNTPLNRSNIIEFENENDYFKPNNDFENDENDKEDDENDNKWTEIKTKYKSNKTMIHNIELDKLIFFPLKDDFPKREIKYFRKKVNFTKSYLFNLMFLLSGNCKINHMTNLKFKINKNNGLKYFIKNEQNFELAIHKWAEECVYYIDYYYDELESFENSRIINQNIFFRKFLIVSGLWEIFNFHDKNFDFIQNHFFTHYMKIYFPTLKELESIVMTEPVSLYLLYLSSLKNVSIPNLDYDQEINENNINIMIKNIFYNLLVLNITNNTIKHKKDEKYWPSNCHKIFYYQKNFGYLKTINVLAEETKNWIPLWFESRNNFLKECIQNKKPFDFIYEFYFDFIRMIGLNEYLNISLKYQSFYTKEFVHYCLNNYINDENDKNYFINELNSCEKWKI